MTLTTEATVPATERAATTGVRATARIAAATRGGTTTLPVLDGDGPFELRRLRSRGTEARVCVVGAMSAPSAATGYASKPPPSRARHSTSPPQPQPLPCEAPPPSPPPTPYT